MPEVTLADPVQPHDQSSGEYSDVLAQFPDMHPDLRNHVERLAAQADETTKSGNSTMSDNVSPDSVDPQPGEEGGLGSSELPQEDIRFEIGETALEGDQAIEASASGEPRTVTSAASNPPSEDTGPVNKVNATADRGNGSPTDEPPRVEGLTKEEREAAAEKWVSEHLVTEKVPPEDSLFGDETKVTLKLKDGETVPPEFGSEVVAKLLDHGDYHVADQLLENLGRFSGLDNNIANRLLENYPSQVLDHINSFAGLTFDRQLADKILQLGNGYLVVEHIQDFKDIKLDAAFADQMVETGNAGAVIDDIDSFEGVKLDADFVDRALKVQGNGYAIAKAIQKFPDIDPNDELAQKIISVDGSSAIVYSLENFHDLSNATASKLLAERYNRGVVFEHIQVFPSLTPDRLLQIISQSPDSKLLGLDSLPAQMQSDLLMLMIDRDGYEPDTLRHFSALDGRVAKKLIDQGYIVAVLQSMDRFSGFEFDLEFAKQVMARIEGHPDALIYKIEKFPKELHGSIAQLIIDRGYADQLGNLVEDGSIQVDQVLAGKIAAVKAAMRGHASDGGVSAYLDNFPNTDHQILAQRLTDKSIQENKTYSDYDLERISEGLNNLEGLGDSIAEKLISNGGQEVLAEHLSSFDHLSSSIAERLIADKLVVNVLLNQDVFDDFVLTAGQGLQLLKDGKWSSYSHELKVALEQMNPDKAPVFDNELAHKMIDTFKVSYLGSLFELFDNLDEDVAKNLIKSGYAGKVLDNPHRFVAVDQLDLAKFAIGNYAYLEVFKRLDQIEGLGDLSAEGDKNVQKFIELINDKELLSLLGEDGPLHILSDQFLGLYMQSDNYQAVRTQLKALVDGNTALWRINHEYAKLLIGEVGNVGYLSGYKVSAVPLALPRRDIGTVSSEIPRPVPFAELDEASRRMVLSQEYVDLHPDIMTVSEVNFTDLNSDIQDTLLAYRLYEAIASSRDVTAQTQASERNKVFAEAGQYWQLGDLVHATGSVGSLRSILLSGVLCGETIGAATAQDSYPFNVDTVVVSEEVLAGKNHQARLDALENRGYGDIVLLFHRTPESTDFGRETQGGMNKDHRLVFGAIPSTEISAILMRASNPEERALVIDSVVESGVYIPIIDENGSLILGFENYQTRRADGNYMSVQPRVLDSSFQRDNSQLGSNEGAMFVIPEASGISRYYVKFGDSSSEKRDHLWTEILTDRIYRAVTPQLVPETDAVIVEGRLAKASKIVDVDENAQITDEARNAGFIMDAFLGNWDAVFNSANLVMTSDGRAMRIDTGNGLDFRARGEHKEKGSFGEVVQEVEVGTDSSRLGSGMRQMYPGLTDDDIKSQVRELRDRLPDEMIDALVESIRRPKAERAELARILKARKQFLIEKFL